MPETLYTLCVMCIFSVCLILIFICLSKLTGLIILFFFLLYAACPILCGYSAGNTYLCLKIDLIFLCYK